MYQADPKTGPDAELAALSRELEAALGAPREAAAVADADVDGHRRIVGGLTIALAAVVLLLARALLLALAAWFDVAEPGGPASALVWTGALIGASAMAVTGWFVMAGRPWARVPLWLIAAGSLFLVPVGTAYGIYAIWVLLKWEKRR